MRALNSRKIEVSFDSSEFLDRVLPLRGASHAEVDHYDIEIPTRYARCVGVLKDGRHVPFANCRQLLGWSGHGEKRSILFNAAGRQIELRVDPADAIGSHSPGHVCQVRERSTVAKPCNNLQQLAGRCRSFIAPDGALLSLPR